MGGYQILNSDARCAQFLYKNACEQHAVENTGWGNRNHTWPNSNCV